MAFMGVKEPPTGSQPGRQRRNKQPGEECGGQYIEQCRASFGAESLATICASCPD
jgi:hypothetical protein